eukprot:1022221-Rhodomonas_salina.1
MPMYGQWRAVLFRHSVNEVLGRSACRLRSVGAYLLYRLISLNPQSGCLLWALLLWGAASDTVYRACCGAALLPGLQTGTAP